jgi:hypothetical protein
MEEVDDDVPITTVVDPGETQEDLGCLAVEHIGTNHHVYGILTICHSIDTDSDLDIGSGELWVSGVDFVPQVLEQNYDSSSGIIHVGTPFKASLISSIGRCPSTDSRYP